MPVDPERWLADAIKGDATAFNRLVDYHQSMAYHVAYHQLGNADGALDACQDAMISAWRAIGRFEGNLAGFRAWLARIVVNACRDQIRYERRRPTAPLEVPSDDGDDYVLPLPDSTESPEEHALRQDHSRALERALGLLTDEHREVVLLDHSGFSYAEIAGILGVEVGTVKSRLSRARARMRDLLTESGLHPGAGGGSSTEPADSRTRSETEPPKSQHPIPRQPRSQQGMSRQSMSRQSISPPSTGGAGASDAGEPDQP